MPNTHRILNLPGFTIKNVSGYKPLVLDVNYTRISRCGRCNSKRVRIKDSFIRTVKHETIGHIPTVLRLKAHKFYCHACKRYSNQQFPGIAKYQRATERVRAQAFFQHTQGISQKTVASNLRVGIATVERWYQYRYQLESGETSNSACPTVLGIDEHFFRQKQGFATTFCNLKKHKIYDVVKGKSERSLRDYLSQLKGKEEVKIVCMDLSPSYRSIVSRYFPNAMIVADRFHVIRLMQHQFIMTYRTLAPDIKHNRGIMAILRKHPSKLSAKQINRQQRFFDDNPIIKILYDMQIKLHKLLMNKTCHAKKCKRLIPELLHIVKQLKESSFERLNALGRTFTSWLEPIVRMWRFSKTNGITEGFHRKMKLIQRRAYGFRNFENYRTRVKVLCG